MRNLTVAMARTAYEGATNQSLDWPELARLLTTHMQLGTPDDFTNDAALERAKATAPVFMLGSVKADGPKTKANMATVELLAIDCDKMSAAAINQVASKLAPFTYALYTTHRHGREDEALAGLCRVRIVLPLAEPLAPAQFLPTWDALQAFVGGANDDKTRNVNRLNYFPTCPDPARAFASVNNAPRWVSASDLGAGAILPASTSVSAPAPNVPNENTTPAAAPNLSVFANIENLPASMHIFRPLNVADLETIRRRMGRIRDIDAAELWKKVLRGASFAGEGDRHDTLLNLTWALAKRFSGVTDQQLTILFAPTLALMAKEATGAPEMTEVITAYKGAVKRIEDLKKDTKDTRENRAAEVQHDAQREASIGDVELANIAAMQGCTVADLRRRWVVQYGASYYFLGRDGSYSRPCGQAEAEVAAAQFLGHAPIDLFSINSKGDPRRKAIKDLVIQYGTLALRVIGDLTTQVSYFDGHTLFEALAPLRITTPVYHAQIDQWLQLFAGPEYNKLLDWLAVAPDLRRISCAIYLAVQGGAGKNMLAHGLAKLWKDGAPTEAGAIFENFNEDLAQCPLVFADEELPKLHHGESVTTKLRSFISVKDRALKRKHLSSINLHGAARVILAANNEFLLEQKGAATTADLEAIASRFLYIEVKPEAKAFLEQLPQETKDYWLAQGIAEHALYLAATRQVIPGKRFAVEGDITAMHRALLTRTEYNGLVCEWLVRYLLNPIPGEQASPGLIRRSKGKLLVNAQAVADGWLQYLRTKTEANTVQIQQALRTISPARVQRRYKGVHVWYRVIDTNYLFMWSEQNGIGSDEQLRATLETNDAKDEG